MKKLQVGIIGLGGIARAHCQAIAALDNVEIVAVADLFEEKRREYMEKYDIPRGYASHTELLADEEVEAVAVVLGHQLHHRLTIDACNAGKHVLVEKPMALSLTQCDEMIAAAATNNVKLMVGYTQHFYGTSLKAKEFLDSGQLGPLITAVSYMSKNWNAAARRPQYRSRYHGGGMWLTNGVHVVDRLTWMMASQAVSVSAAIGTRAHYQAVKASIDAGKLGQIGLIRMHRWNSKITEKNNDIPDRIIPEIDIATWFFDEQPKKIFSLKSPSVNQYIQLHLQFENKGMVIIDDTEALPEGGDYFSLSVIGEKGATYADDQRNMNLIVDGRYPHAIRTGQGAIHIARQLQAFVNSVRGEHPPPLTHQDILKVLQVSEAVLEAITANKVSVWEDGTYACHCRHTRCPPLRSRYGCGRSGQTFAL